MSDTRPRAPEDLSLYFNHLIAGISPLVSLKLDHKVHFANDSFVKEFDLMGQPIVGRDFFSVLSLSPAHQLEVRNNLQRSQKAHVDNCEFVIRKRIYGYSIFRFGEENVVILKDITERKLLERKIEGLHSRLLSVQEKERQKLAAELHDSVGQTILAAKLNFAAYHQNQDEERFEAGIKLIDRASQELREIYVNLFPSALRDLGLEAAVRGFARDFLAVKGIETEFIFDMPAELAADVETSLFRMIQEIFTNIVKHSQADSVQLEADQPGPGLVRLVVSENGIGFSPEEMRSKKGSYGLENIHRRVEDLGGSLSIFSGQGEGTTFEITLPVESPLEHDDG